MPPRKGKRVARFKQAVDVDSHPGDSRDAEPVPDIIKTEDEDVSMNSTALPPDESQNDLLITETVADLTEAVVGVVEPGDEDVSMSSDAPPPDESQNADPVTMTVKTEDVDQQADGSQTAEPSTETGKAMDVDVAMNSLGSQPAVLQTLPYDYVHYKHKGDIGAAVKEIFSNLDRHNASYFLNLSNFDAATDFLMSYLVAFEYGHCDCLLHVPSADSCLQKRLQPIHSASHDIQANSRAGP